jgi:predicted nucleotidyltransferase
MKITGLITEYNPFHNGHLYHIQKAREITQCDLLICVMSGHFVQRGEPTILDKWQRTQAALNHGVDLVLELPYPYVVQSAKHFANASVRILELVGCTDIVFGSESNDLESLQLMAELPINVDGLKEHLSQGMGYPKAYGMVHGSYHPNDILAIAYLKAIQNTAIQAHTIARTNHYHDETINSDIASATAIRKAVRRHQDVSNTTPMADALKQAKPISWDNYFTYIQTLLISLDKQDLSEIFLMDEGLENHLSKQIKYASDFESFMQASISKRYTRARIQRALVHLLTHTKRCEIKKLAQINTLRVLGFNELGQDYLKRFRDNEHVHVASRFNQVPRSYRNIEMRATSVYAHALDAEERLKLIQREIEGPILHKRNPLTTERTES